MKKENHWRFVSFNFTDDELLDLEQVEVVVKEIETEKEAEAARKRAGRGGPPASAPATIAPTTTSGVDAGGS